MILGRIRLGADSQKEAITKTILHRISMALACLCLDDVALLTPADLTNMGITAIGTRHLDFPFKPPMKKKKKTVPGPI